MKNTLLLIFLLSLFNNLVASPINAEILSLSINTLDNKTITLSNYIDKKPVYLKFWATWCQPCRKQMPHFQKTQDNYGNKIKVIAINLGVNDSIKLVNETKNEFGLTMPIAIDTSGDLAQAFNLIGTPFHVLIDKKGNVVHTGFEASSELDKKIALLATDNSTYQKEVPVHSSETIKSPAHFNDLQKNNTILFFVATWCDWYLKESRPDISTRCINAQNTINTLYKKFPEYNWVGVVSRLWTGDTELKEYSEKYNISHPLAVDTSNEIFFKYKVKNFPTLIVLNNGKEVLRINEFNNIEYLAKKLKQYN